MILSKALPASGPVPLHWQMRARCSASSLSARETRWDISARTSRIPGTEAVSLTKYCRAEGGWFGPGKLSSEPARSRIVPIRLRAAIVGGIATLHHAGVIDL
jgi:hypothetical protein